ncbi:MAG TPA: AAA family ATPase, partial [Rubrobacter sp.]|nr:AAA family ATPase [Rubrobacter sp.]
MDHNDFAERVERIVGNVERAVSGKRDGVLLAVVAMLAGGHVLIEDVPGVGKTLLAKSLARSLRAEFRRIQFTPDLLPADVTGLNVYNQGEGDFEFWPGPVFANVVLAD